ncbi:threonylcarbamoyl-AMP synthase [Thermosulfurimonas marina]|uniref:L-threonylcarbamoyladenylate synthase n=1 Tax=Thermosulfurimonas marina TaxID=2047767 RepID=A0A6H1WSD7_9BACT|nr:L-threonylcarbamoyladenylate synthase [Thermosulfurimonas marina]QJA06135.1 threonylcarbamoyl-AMP synthase [Thermosulfurimonas marina]
MKILRAEEEEALSEALRVLSEGGLVGFPTETFYGLGADPFNPAAIERLYEVKRRRRDKPVLLLLGDREEVGRLVEEIPPVAELLMEHFWPGPLTIVFRARTDIPPWLTAETGTVALRVSSHPLARDLPRLFRGPVTGTSANLSEEPPARTAEEVAHYFPEIDLILDGGPCPGEKPSTLVSVVSERVELLRPGAVPWEKIEKLLKSFS